MDWEYNFFFSFLPIHTNKTVIIWNIKITQQSMLHLRYFLMQFQTLLTRVKYLQTLNLITCPNLRKMLYHWIQLTNTAFKSFIWDFEYLNSGLLYAKLLDITWYKRKINFILFQCCVGMYSSRFSCTVPTLFSAVSQTDCFVVLFVSLIVFFLVCFVFI